MALSDLTIGKAGTANPLQKLVAHIETPVIRSEASSHRTVVEDCSLAKEFFDQNQIAKAVPNPLANAMKSMKLSKPVRKPIVKLKYPNMYVDSITRYSYAEHIISGTSLKNRELIYCRYLHFIRFGELLPYNCLSKADLLEPDIKSVAMREIDTRITERMTRLHAGMVFPEEKWVAKYQDNIPSYNTCIDPEYEQVMTDLYLFATSGPIADENFAADFFMV